MDTATLYIIQSIFEMRSIRAVARREGRSPAVVSAALARFEAALAVPMFRRDGTSLSLTLEAERRAAALAQATQDIRRLMSVGRSTRSVAAISLSALERFITIAYSGSIRTAAKSLQIGQPQLTRQLTDLEQRLKCRLVERSRAGVNCSPAGLRALPLAERIVDHWREMSEASSDRFRRNIGTWRFGTVTPLGHESSLARMLARLTAEWGEFRPHQPLAISGQTADELMSGLKARRFDAILIDHTSVPAEFDRELLSTTPLALVGNATLAVDKADDLGALIMSAPIALPSVRSGIRQAADNFLAEVLTARQRQKIRLVEVDSFPTIVNLVARYGHLSVLPGTPIQRLPFALTLRPLPDRYCQSLALVWRQRVIPEAVAQMMIAALRHG